MMLRRNEQLASIALSSRLGIGSVTYRKLIEFAGSAERVFSFSRSELRDLPDVRTDIATSIIEFDHWESIEAEMKTVEESGASLIPWQDTAYPRNLRQIHDPPPILYARGEIMTRDSLAIAVVGSRLPTEYGESVVDWLVRDLALRGVTVVSGLARGIDTASHETALQNGGRTLAVLGSGIDVVYPRENERLFSQITRNGAVLTEFPPTTPPSSEHFPRRNRIISGLSLGVLIVEASVRSGSLITATYALEQGREVFAVPGRITSGRSRGTNQLIQQGAKLVSNANDIFDEIFPLIDSDTAAHIIDSQYPHPSSDKPTLEFSPGEQHIFNLLGEDPVSIDQIITRSGMPPGDISESLLTLELKGIIRRHPGHQYSRNHLSKS